MHWWIRGMTVQETEEGRTELARTELACNVVVIQSSAILQGTLELRWPFRVASD